MATVDARKILEGWFSETVRRVEGWFSETPLKVRSLAAFLPFNIIKGYLVPVLAQPIT